MQEIILKPSNKSNKKIEATAGIIKGMVMSRSVSSTRCASYMPGNAKLESKIKRVERCYAKSYVDEEEAVHFLCSNFSQDSGVICSLDRTNWEYGKNDINALVLYGKGFSSCGMINLKLLDNKGGSSNFNDRKHVLEVVLANMKEKIRVLLCDREFFSFEFADYLISVDLPFVIRIKKSLKCAKRLIKILKNAGKTIREAWIGKFKGKDIYLDLSAKKKKGDYLILVSYKVANPLKMYRNRWSIECFFKCLKTAGFNIEATKLTLLPRLQSLFLLCGMAYAFCVKIGLYVHNKIEKIKFKKTLNCYQFTFFRYGLDWLTRVILPPPKIYKLCQFFRMLNSSVR
jgi:hypothetical protein